MSDSNDGDFKSRDEARKAILARRAKFVTVALAGAGIAMAQACKDKARVCLEVEQLPPPSASPTPCLTEAVPGPCLEAPMPDPEIPDAGTDAGADAGDVKPRVCLRVAPPPPRPCLSPTRKKDPTDEF